MTPHYLQLLLLGDRVYSATFWIWAEFALHSYPIECSRSDILQVSELGRNKVIWCLPSSSWNAAWRPPYDKEAQDKRAYGREPQLSQLSSAAHSWPASWRQLCIWASMKAAENCLANRENYVRWHWFKLLSFGVFYSTTKTSQGFPGGTSVKQPTCQCRRHKRRRFNPWVMKIP